MILQIAGFALSILVLAWLSSKLVTTLTMIAEYLGWREFIIAFFVVGLAGSLPNFFVDINAALQGMPEVAFGDIVGGNLVDLTLVIAIAVFFSPKSLPAESEMVQKSAIFTSVIAVLPILLVWDRSLDRIDGVILLIAFTLYSWWLFSKGEHFKKTYKKRPKSDSKSYFSFLINIVKIIFFLIVLLGVSFFIVDSVEFFSVQLGMSLSLVAILILGLGNCFPEIYFSIISAKKGGNWLILGDLMGSVIICSTLVLGVVALLFPFEIKDFSPFLMTRIFMIIASLLFIVFIRTDRKITKKEGVIFLSIYIIFLISQVFMPYFIK